MRWSPSLSIACILLGACSPHPSEPTLLREFEQNRAKFDELADMAEEDSAFSRIARDFAHPKTSDSNSAEKGKLEPSRWQSYRQSFDELNLDAGVTIYDNEVIVLERSTSGIVTAGSSIGFMRTRELPKSLRMQKQTEPLDCEIGEEGWCSVAKHISDDWYLVIERH